MPRMSDILKKIKASQDFSLPELNKVSDNAAENNARENINTEISEKAAAESEKEPSACTYSFASPLDAYNTLISCAAGIFDYKKTSVDPFLDGKHLMALFRDFLSVFPGYKDDLLKLAYQNNTAHDNYLIAHAVNSTVYSIALTAELEMSGTQSAEIAVSIFLHDIGMKEYLSLVNQPVSMAKAEYETLKYHTTRAEYYLRQIPDLPELAYHVAKSHHERQDGTGYPEGLKKNKLHSVVKLAAFCDVYAALVQPRAYRDKFNSVKALDILLQQKDRFSRKVIRAFIQEIGVYPPGAKVELNTGEYATVINVRTHTPMRPVIVISSGDAGVDPVRERVMDLADHSAIYIRDIVA